MAAPTIDRTNYNNLLDDDGTNTVGTNWSKNQVKICLLDPTDTLAAALSTQIVVTTAAINQQDNFAPGISGACTILRCNNASLLTITGFAGGADGMRLVVQSIGGGQINFLYQNAGSTAANRLTTFVTSGITSLAAGVGVAEFIYSTASGGSWILVQHEQGAPIDYSATSTIVGWSSFTNQKINYYLKGRTLTVNYILAGPSNTSTATFTIPYTTVNDDGGYAYGFHQSDDNTVIQATPGVGQAVPNSATITLRKDAASGAWTNGGTKQAVGVIAGIKVQ